MNVKEQENFAKEWNISIANIKQGAKKRSVDLSKMVIVEKGISCERK